MKKFVCAEPISAKELAHRIMIHRTAMHNVLTSEEILEGTREYAESMGLNMNTLLEIVKDEEDHKMKKMVEARFCDVCELRGQIAFTRDELHLCSNCMTNVLERVTPVALTAAILMCRKEKGKK